MNHLKLSKVFNESVEKYLDEIKPRFDFQKFSLQMVESEIRDYFARKLEKRGYNIKKEALYPNSSLRCDILLNLDNKNIFIEIKQSAKWTDSIQQKDLTDFEKLNNLKENFAPNDVKAIFVININPKYEKFPKEWETYVTPLHLPCRNIGLKGLSKYWKKSVEDSEKQYFRFFLKEYIYPNPEDLNHIMVTREYPPPFRLNSITLCYVSDKCYL